MGPSAFLLRVLAAAAAAAAAWANTPQCCEGCERCGCESLVGWNRIPGSEVCVTQGGGGTAATCTSADCSTTSGAADISIMHGNHTCRLGTWAQADAFCTAIGGSLCDADFVHSGAASLENDNCQVDLGGGAGSVSYNFYTGGLWTANSDGCGVGSHVTSSPNGATNCESDSQLRPIRCCAEASCPGWTYDCHWSPRTSRPSAGKAIGKHDADARKRCEEAGDHWDEDDFECEGKALRMVFIFVCIGCGILLIVFCILVIWPTWGADSNEERQRILLEQLKKLKEGEFKDEFKTTFKDILHHAKDAMHSHHHSDDAPPATPAVPPATPAVPEETMLMKVGDEEQVPELPERSARSPATVKTE